MVCCLHTCYDVTYHDKVKQNGLEKKREGNNSLGREGDELK